MVMGEPVTDKKAGTVAATLVTVPLPPEEAIVMPPDALVMVIPLPAVNVVRVKPVPLPISNCPFVGVAVKPVPPLAIGKVPVTPVVKGRPDALVNVTEVGVPRIGVTSVGEVDNTLLPEPVEVVTPVPPEVVGKALANCRPVVVSCIFQAPLAWVKPPTYHWCALVEPVLSVA